MKQLDKQIEATEKRIAKFEKNIGMYESRFEKQLQKLLKEGVQLTKEDFQVKPTGRWKYDYDVQLSDKAQALDWDKKYSMSDNVMRAQENRDRLKDEKKSLQKLINESDEKKWGEEQKEAAVKVLLEHLSIELETFRIEWKEEMMKWHEGFYERIHKALPNARVQYKELEQHIQEEQRANGWRPTTRLKQLQTAKASFGRILSAPPASYATMDGYLAMCKNRLDDEWRWTVRGLAEKLLPFDVDTTQMKVMHPRMAERGLDVLIADNKQRVIDARMIWAAEYSEYVTPHTRYIVTERQQKLDETKDTKYKTDMNEPKQSQLQLAIQGHPIERTNEIDWNDDRNSDTMDKGLDRLPFLKERISDVRLIKSGSGQAIRCRIDGCQQTAKRLTDIDMAIAKDESQLLLLAERYFNKELEDSLSQLAGRKR